MSLERARERRCSRGRRASIDATSPGRVVHSPADGQKPWKRREVTIRRHGLSTPVESRVEERVFPAKRRFSRRSGPEILIESASRCDGAIVGASELRAEDDAETRGAPDRADCGKPLGRRRGASARRPQREDVPQLVQRGRAPSAVDDDAFVLAVPNDFTREWIEGHFVELIRAGDEGRDRRRAPAAAHGRQAQPPVPPAPLTLDARAAAAAAARVRGPTAASTRSTRSTRS